MILKIKLETVNNAVLFVAKCSEYSEDIDYIFGKYMVDAKSLIGVISAGLEHLCEVRLHTDDGGVKQKFIEDMEMWRIDN